MREEAQVQDVPMLIMTAGLFAYERLLNSSFLAHLWGAYAIPVALSGVRRPSYVVCRLCPP